MSREEVLRALQLAHRDHHGTFQGGNFFDCDRCRLHVMFNSQALTWKPPRARKERELLTAADVAATVR